MIKLRPYHKLQGKQGTKQDEVWGKKDEKLRLKPWEKVTNEREKTRIFFLFFAWAKIQHYYPYIHTMVTLPLFY